MRKRSAVLAGLLALLCNTFAVAQKSQTVTFRAGIPFDFVIGGQTLQAGIYTFQRLLGKPTQSDHIGVIVVRSLDHRVYKVMVTNFVAADEQETKSRLVFTKADGRRYLKHIHIVGDQWAHELSGGKAESEAGPDKPGVEIALLTDEP
jgi:hypothetical protein